MSRLSREARRRQGLEKKRTDRQQAMRNPSGDSKYAEKQEKKRTGKWVPPEQPAVPSPVVPPSRFSRVSTWPTEENRPIYTSRRSHFLF